MSLIDVAPVSTSAISNRGTVTASERRAEQVVTDCRAALGDLLGADPRGIVLNSKDTRAYVMNYVSRDVTVIDITSTRMLMAHGFVFAPLLFGRVFLVLRMMTTGSWRETTRPVRSMCRSISKPG